MTSRLVVVQGEWVVQPRVMCGTNEVVAMGKAC